MARVPNGTLNVHSQQEAFPTVTMYHPSVAQDNEVGWVLHSHKVWYTAVFVLLFTKSSYVPCYCFSCKATTDVSQNKTQAALFMDHRRR